MPKDENYLYMTTNLDTMSNILDMHDNYALQYVYDSCHHRQVCLAALKCPYGYLSASGPGKMRQIMQKTARWRMLYLKEFLLAMGAYTVVIIVSSILINISPVSAWWRVPLALTPIIPIVFAVIAYMRAVSRMDELQRRIQFEALAFGFGSSALLTFSYGFLENVGFPHVSLIFVFPLMIALWGIGGAIASWRYR